MSAELPQAGDEEGLLGVGVDWRHNAEKLGDQASTAGQSDDIERGVLNDPDVFGGRTESDSEDRPLPAVLLFMQLRIYLGALRGVDSTTLTKAEQMRHDLHLADDSKDDLADRIANTSESDWKAKPIFFTALLREWESRR